MQNMNVHVNSNQSLMGNEQPSDVAIRVNKINIEINKADTNVANKHDSLYHRGSADGGRIKENFSGLTNYKTGQDIPVFDHDAQPQ